VQWGLPMSADRAALRSLASALAPGAAVSVPREWLLELLEGSSRTPMPPTHADLTVAELCARFGRKKSAVRAWLERGDFPGAYRLRGREWRIPPEALGAFEAAQRGLVGKTNAGPSSDLAAWRQLYRT
jgi:excisionase family DNA binding protein